MNNNRHLDYQPDILGMLWNPGDLVLDPFMGSGTTAKMALANGRNYIGFDISADYCAMAERRLAAVTAP